jgi:ribosomal-protein-alanine N-acetyltransferase
LITGDPDLGGDLALQVGPFHLTPLAATDAPYLLAHLADPRVVAFMDIDPLAEVEEALGIIEWARGQRALGAGVRWAVRDGAGAFVGTCGFHLMTFERGRRAEIGYDLSHAWWGRGAMDEVMPAALAFGYGVLGLHRIEAMVTPGTVHSSDLLERHGFLREGILRDYGFWKDRFWDQILYARMASDTPVS